MHLRGYTYSNALNRQASNGHFRLPLASNRLKFYRGWSIYPYRSQIIIVTVIF